MRNSRLIFTLLFTGIIFQCFAQPGALDLSFNKTGKQSFTLKTNRSDDHITASFLQPDGKLLVAGYYNGNFGQLGFISRLNATGETDATFGNNGRVRFQDFETDGVYMSDFIPQSIALQSTGNIVLVGHYGSDGYQPAIANLLSDGSLNKEFNTNGYKIIEDAEDAFGTRASLQTVQIHPSTDNIIACGGTDAEAVLLEGSATVKMLVVALTKTGTPFTYSNKEFITHSLFNATGSNITCSVRFHPDSMYIGVNNNPDGFYHAGVASLSMITGEFNALFANDEEAFLLNDFGAYEANYCHTIALTKDNDILFGGYVSEGAGGTEPQHCVVTKILAASKSVDPLFGDATSPGSKVLQFELSDQQQFLSLALDQNNNIFAGGYYTDESGDRYWASARLSSGGQLLTEFDTDGKKTFPIRTNYGISTIHPVSGGYLLAGTLSISEPTVADGIVKKIDNNGNAATTYANASEATVWARDFFATAENMTLYNGRLWVCGNIPNNSTQQNGGITVLNSSTGAIDASFGGKLGAAPGAFLLPGSSAYPNMWIRNLRFQGNKLIVAATYFNNLTDADELLLMRFNLVDNSLELDTEFGENGYAISTLNAGGIHRVQGLLVQNNGKIIVYGYFGGESAITVLGFTAEGDVDTFAGTGAYIHAESPTDPGERKTMDGKILSNGNLAFTTSVYGPVSGSSDMLVFILAADGSLISNQVYDLFGESSDGACALAEKADGSLFIGGYSNDAYTILSLKTNGVPDTDFDGDGKWVIPNKDNTYNERIVGLYVNGQSLVAVGRANNEEGGEELITAMRLTLKGRNDSTFTGKGYTEIAYSKGKSSLLANDRLYIAGHIEEDGADMVYGDVYKIQLGTGPVIKETKLVLSNEVKTFGTGPFLLKKVTNSPAPITYKITQGTNKATVHPTTGLVTMLHSTYEAGPVVVSATQAAIPGYSSATAEAYITINRGIPTIVFTNQGGIVEDTLKLVFSSNSEGYHYFNSVGSGDVYEFYGEDHVVIIGVGESKIGLYYYSSQDYEEGYAEAIIFGYTALVAPVANNDQAELIYGQQETIKFNVLSNDEAYTGAIVSSKVDLDPGTAGIQSVYVSPSLGLFEADTNGEITYTPFSGFIGSGQITYTITDTKGISSKPANISVAVILQGEAPALKATELITPNNDGLNDAFVIGYVDLEKENILKIYDRTGAELYSKTNYSNDWKGELSNGNAVEDGVYFFLFVEEGNGRKRELKGAIEVKR